jgi:hypothetical protein
MRCRFLAPFLLGGLLCPWTASAQASASSFELQVSGLVSTFRFERGVQAQWRTTSSIRLRTVFNDRVFGELSYSAPFISDVPYDCLLVGPCHQDLTAWHFSILSGGLGVFLGTGEWRPFVGASRGRFGTEDESHGTWITFAGLERSLKGRLGLVIEYRLGSVDWPNEGGVSLNHEIGVGLTISAGGSSGGTGSAP